MLPPAPKAEVVLPVEPKAEPLLEFAPPPNAPKPDGLPNTDVDAGAPNAEGVPEPPKAEPPPPNADEVEGVNGVGVPPEA